MPFCFAYGSNMDRAAMGARCPSARPVGLARLAGHRVVIMREGYATVFRDPRAEAHGLLWDVPLSDMPALDRYEDLAGGLYVKRLAPVLTAAGPRRAQFYIGNNAGPGVPRPGYLEGVLAAAAAAGLSPSYVARLAALGQAGAPAPDLRIGPARPTVAVRPTRSSPMSPDRGADRQTPWEP